LSAKNRETANVGAGNWKGVGMWAWLLFRISGLILAAYLFVHIGVISQGRLSGASDLNEIFATFDKPIFVFFDLLLVAAVLYHGMNGVRIILMDLGIGIKEHKTVLYVVMAVAAVCLAVFTVVAFPHIFPGSGS